MSRKKRDRNRALAKELEWNSHVCPECGERGKHWVGAPMSIQDWMLGSEQQGFWTCAKFYDETGRRM